MKKLVALILVFCIMSSGFQSRAELAVEQITQTNEIITDSSIPTAEVDTEPTPESFPTQTSEPSSETTPELPDPAMVSQTIMSSDRINAEDSDNGDGDGEPLFAEDRVLVKIYSNIFRRSFPDLGIEYSEMHLLNPSKKQEDNGLF